LIAIFHLLGTYYNNCKESQALSSGSPASGMMGRG